MVVSRPMASLIVALAMLITLTFAAGPARAQDNLSTDLVTAEALTSEQQQTVQRYLAQWGEQLRTADASQITPARQRLIEPMNNPTGPSEAFLSYYSPRLATYLEEALDSDRLIVRLNAMIVATRMASNEALPLIEKGLVDENAGVRYWAAKAVQHLAENDAWTQQQGRNLLARLVNQLGTEQTGWVVQQLMLATVELDVPEASGQVLDALNQRVQDHFQEPGRSLQAEQAGLDRLWRQMIADERESRTRRQLARTAYRYMRLAGTHLSRGNIPEEHQASYATVIEDADRIMRTLNEQLNGSQDVPEVPAQAVRQQDWDRVLVIADRWEQVLQGPPFNFLREELAFTSPDEEEESETPDEGDAEQTDAAEQTPANPGNLPPLE